MVTRCSVTRDIFVVQRKAADAPRSGNPQGGREGAPVVEAETGDVGEEHGVECLRDAAEVVAVRQCAVRHPMRGRCEGGGRCQPLMVVSDTQ